MPGPGSAEAALALVGASWLATSRCPGRQQAGSYKRPRAGARAGKVRRPHPSHSCRVNAPAELHPTSTDERIALALSARGRLKDADLGRAQRLHAEAGGSLSALLVRLGMVSERDMAEAAADVLALPLVSAKDCPDAPPPGVQLSLRFLKQLAVCPIGEDDTHVDLLVAEPQDPYAADAVALATGRAVRVKVGLRAEIADLLERYYGSGRSAMGTIVENLGDESGGDEADVEQLRDLASEAPVIRLVNLIIQRAV